MLWTIRNDKINKKRCEAQKGKKEETTILEGEKNVWHTQGKVNRFDQWFSFIIWLLHIFSSFMKLSY